VFCNRSRKKGYRQNVINIKVTLLAQRSYWLFTNYWTFFIWKISQKPYGFVLICTHLRCNVGAVYTYWTICRQSFDWGTFSVMVKHRTLIRIHTKHGFGFNFIKLPFRRDYTSYSHYEPWEACVTCWLHPWPDLRPTYIRTVHLTSHQPLIYRAKQASIHFRFHTRHLACKGHSNSMEHIMSTSFDENTSLSFFIWIDWIRKEGEEINYYVLLLLS